MRRPGVLRPMASRGLAFARRLLGRGPAPGSRLRTAVRPFAGHGFGRRAPGPWARLGLVFFSPFAREEEAEEARPRPRRREAPMEQALARTVAPPGVLVSGRAEPLRTSVPAGLPPTVAAERALALSARATARAAAAEGRPRVSTPPVRFDHPGSRAAPQGPAVFDPLAVVERLAREREAKRTRAEVVPAAPLPPSAPRPAEAVPAPAPPAFGPAPGRPLPPRGLAPATEAAPLAPVARGRTVEGPPAGFPAPPALVHAPVVRGEAPPAVPAVVREVVRAEPVVPRGEAPPAAGTEPVRAAPVGAGERTAATGVPAAAWLAPAAALMRAVRAEERARVAAEPAPLRPAVLPATAAAPAAGVVRPVAAGETRAGALGRRIASRAAALPSAAPSRTRPGDEGIAFPRLPSPVLAPRPGAPSEAETRRVVERVLGRFAAPRAEAPPAAGEAAAEAPAATTRTARVAGEPRSPAMEHAPVAVAPSIGFPLPARLRERMQALLGFDPGGVRLHTGDAAARAARRLGAAAFTVGSDVFFAPGRYAPESRAGLGLLAHELAHVRQHPLGRPFRAEEMTPGRRATLEAEARGSEARVHAPRPAPAQEAAWPPLAVTLAPLAAPAAPMLAPEDGAPRGDAEMAPGGPAPAAPAGGGAGAGAAAGGASAEAVAEEVYRLIRERMRVERERRGIQPWT